MERVAKDTVAYIQQQLQVPEDLIYQVYESFAKVKEHSEHGIVYQYLAHLRCTLEGIIREKVGYPLFTIELHKLAEDDPELKVGTAKYVPDTCFIVYYHPRLEDKQLRVCLAHELGHLFAELLFEHYDPTMDIEAISNLFGIFKILDKDDFYKNQARSYCHVSTQAVVDSFVQMQNRKQGVFHSSASLVK